MIDGTAAMEAIGDYFAAFVSDLSPARRKMVARKVGQRLRRLNTARIAANIEPSGEKMAPRKARRELRGAKSRAGKPMFRKLKLARNFEIRPDSEGVELRVKSGAVGIARVHQEGSVGYVGKTRARKTIRARYERRQLLGFATQDLDALTEELLGWLDRDK